eukprot:926574-Pelagomonas_calceolata.AAC.2
MGYFREGVPDTLHLHGTYGGGFGRVAVESRRRRVRASRSMASNPPDPHKLYFWLSTRLAVSTLEVLGHTLSVLVICGNGSFSWSMLCPAFWDSFTFPDQAFCNARGQTWTA